MRARTFLVTLTAFFAVVGSSSAIASDLVTPACLDEVQAGDVHLRLSASKDARVMKNHPKANDGGAGLMWIKRGHPVRGLVGFDLSCLDARDATALAAVRCATLELSVRKGRASKRRQAIFHAHRLAVPWDEGTEARNRLRFRRGRLGPHPGDGPGVTWACRSDFDTSWPRDIDCAPEDLWTGGDEGSVCGSGPCYDTYGGTPPATEFAHKKQPTVAWDVTADVNAFDPTTAVDDLSWLLKVSDETVKAGGVRVFTREGADLYANFDPAPNAGAHFDKAPTLHLYGPTLPGLSLSALSPTNPVSTETACVSFASASGVVRARWENLTTGEWGWMEESTGCATGWSATVPLSTAASEQPNQLEITALDACAQEAIVEHSITYAP